MEKPFKNYTVIETEGMSAEGLQKLLNKATDGFPEKQIEHVIGSKIILSHESLLNEKGRAEVGLKNVMQKGFNNMVGGTIRGGA